MSRRWLMKLLMIGGLMLLLLLPLSALRGLVHERQARGLEVAEGIAASSSRAQHLLGPLIVVQGSRTSRRERIVTENGVMRTVAEEQKLAERHLLMPQRLTLDGQAQHERRGRSVFSSLLYHATLGIDAEYDLAPLATLLADPDFKPTTVEVVLALGDSRGIGKVELTLDGEPVAVQPGARGLDATSEGLHASLPRARWDRARLVLRLDLALTGTDTFAIVPIGDDNRITLRSDWPHPGFGGEHLPSQRSIDATGFQAEWQVSRLSSRAQTALAACAGGEDSCGAAYQSALSVRLVDPVDNYLLSERALKYALLFLVLVFGAVFFVEALRAVEVHLIQYGLTGLALAIFYLLLLALAEHVGFALAYLIAAAACVSLIAHYMGAVLGGSRRGLAFGGLLAGLYGLLYGVLQSEDYALLTGALALFGLLAAVMLLTRRLDWSALSSGRSG